ncbi:MAG: hypothetical protein KGH58_03890 [Candidatus Micrarchaeota archaeon]|nr:hypothetical protein [Candidatus Micrarchaeota archaeon]
MAENSSAATIAGIYGRLVRVFGTQEILLVGGSAMILTSEPGRQLKDIDLAVEPARLYGIPRELAEQEGFRPGFDGSRLIELEDMATGIEVEASSKSCGNLNSKLGIPPYTEQRPTIIGLPLIDVISRAERIELNGARMCIPSREDQVLMKYNLWKFRGEGRTRMQKDADDISKIVRFYYRGVDAFLEMRGSIEPRVIGTWAAFEANMRAICQG